MIEDIKSGNPDYSDMEPALRVAFHEQENKALPILQSLGRVEEISFEGKDRGIDVYLVRFEKGKTVWQFARSPSGRIAVLFFNLIPD